MSPIDPCLAVIPARGGSRGLPGKNIRPLAGLPLLEHSVRCAKMVPRIARVIVSTDDEKIADVARQAGAEVPFMRPDELARDDTPMWPVLQHALAEMNGQSGTRFGSLLLLDPTSPGRVPEDIARACEILDGDVQAAGVVACSKPTFNPFWVGVVEKGGYLARAFDMGHYVRRQDVPAFYRVNGALYLWRAAYIESGSDDWLSAPERMLEIPESRAFSIDDLDEFEHLELLVTSGRVKLPWLEGAR